MRKISKKIILILIVITESFIGFIFLSKTYNAKIVNHKVLGASIATSIDKSKTVFEQSEGLEHYWKLEPKEWTEKPEWLPYEVLYHINNDGLREKYDYPIEKPFDTYRVITLGDSFTYGHHVNAEDNWSEQLEVMLNNVVTENCEIKNYEVINLGMPGYDIQYIVQRYKELGQKYDPDLILWFDSGTGFSRNNEVMQPLINECVEDISDYNNYAICYNKAYQQVRKEHSKKEFLQSAQNNLNTFFKLNSTDNTVVFYYENLSKNNEKIVNKWQNKFKEATFISLVPQPKRNERLPDNHPNKKGHETIAKSIFEYINNNRNICE